MIVKTSVSLPDALLDAAKRVYQAKGYTSLSAYLQDLLRRDIRENPTPEIPSIKEEPTPYKASGDSSLASAVEENTKAVRELINHLSKQTHQKAG